MSSPFSRPTVHALGEDALLLRFGDTIDAGCNARVHAAARQIRSARPSWFRDLVPAYASLALFVDPTAFPHGSDPLHDATRWLRSSDGVQPYAFLIASLKRRTDSKPAPNATSVIESAVSRSSA